MNDNPSPPNVPAGTERTTTGTAAPTADALILEGAEQLDRSPFTRQGLGLRLLPFAVVAVVAMVSVLLPQGGLQSWQRLAIAAALLAFVAVAAFGLPWARLPSWIAVVVPLVFTVSMLALTLSAGATSGVGLVLLAPLVWSVLFHRRWESACVLAAIVAAQVAISLEQAASDVTLARRVVLWTALGMVILLATHGLRDRIRRSQHQAVTLRAQLFRAHEVRARDRIAAGLGETVIRRLFAAGMDLNSAASRITDDQARNRLLAGVSELDQAIRQVQHLVYDLSPTTGPAQPPADVPAPAHTGQAPPPG
ncbi:MAG TPA: hypothetical protein VGE95_11110, partial [Arthrobacter sp.]